MREREKKSTPLRHSLQTLARVVTVRLPATLLVVISYVTGVSASILLHSVPALWAGGLAAATLLPAAVKVRNSRLSLPVLLLAFACLGLFAGTGRLMALEDSLLAGLSGKQIVLEATVSELPRSRGVKTRFVANAGFVSWAGGRYGVAVDEDVLVELFCHDGCLPPMQKELKEGTRISIHGALSEPLSAPESDFDYGLYLRRRGINAVITAAPEKLTVLPGGRGGAAGVVDQVRNHARNSLGIGDWGAAGSLLKGMVLGDDRQVPDNVIDDFRASGLLHLLAVSGQNVVLLAFVVMFICRIFGVARIPAAAIAALAVCIYVPVTGAGPSIVRAGIVGVLGLAALILSRQISPYHFLALAAAAILSINPYSLLDPGFQLSFGAVLAIFLVAPMVASPIESLPLALREAVAIATAAGLATAPITLVHFHQVSLVTVPANVAAAPVAGVVMLLGTISILVAPLTAEAAWLLNAAASVCTGYLIVVARLFASLPGAVYTGSSPGLVAIALFYGMLTGMVAIWRHSRPGALAARLKKHRGLAIAAAVLFATLLGFACLGGEPAGTPPAAFTVSFLDVGQGDAVLIQDPEGATVLIDGGPGTAIASLLKRSGVERLDAVILSHPHADHLAGLKAVLDKYPVGAVYDAASPSSSPLYRDFLKLAESKGIPYSVLRQGRALEFGELRLAIFSPGERQKEDDMNANSVVAVASYRGLDILCPGDAEGDVLATLDLPEVEVYKVGHHGSRDEHLKQVLDRVRPGVAVISAGEGNSYGHPADETLAKLMSAGARVFRTDRQGTVRVSLAGGNLQVETER